MRLAYLSADRGIRYGGSKGAAVHMGEITGALAAQGAEVHVLVAMIDAHGDPPPAGVTVEVAPHGADDLARRLDACGAQVLVERLSLHGVDGSAAAATLGIPHLVEVNAPLAWEAATYRGLEDRDEAERREAEVLARATIVLAVSRPLAEHARACGARRVEVVPNAAAVDRFPPRSHMPDPQKPARAVLAGSLRPWHGVATVADAWRIQGPALPLGGSAAGPAGPALPLGGSAAGPAGPGAPPLLVVGDGEGRDALEAVGARVTGRVPHHRVPSLLAGCDIGLVPYAADAPRYFSPLKLFDCMAAGLAVIAADLPGVTDIVDGDTAVVVPPGDAGALAGAVRALAADPERRAELGRAARRLVEEHHTWAHRARRILELAEEAARVTTP